MIHFNNMLVPNMLKVINLTFLEHTIPLLCEVIVIVIQPMTFVILLGIWPPRTLFLKVLHEFLTTGRSDAAAACQATHGHGTANRTTTGACQPKWVKDKKRGGKNGRRTAKLQGGHRTTDRDGHQDNQEMLCKFATAVQSMFMISVYQVQTMTSARRQNLVGESCTSLVPSLGVAHRNSHAHIANTY
jgi:hypothetical protein